MRPPFKRHPLALATVSYSALLAGLVLSSAET